MSLAPDQFDQLIIEPLTRRECEVVALLMSGESTSEAIAAVLCIEPGTVKFHVGSIMRKLNVHRRAEVVSFAWLHGSLVEAETSVLSWQPRA